MHLKIQGGGTGRMANQGSSSSLISYLQHEDLENIKKGKKVEPFFSHDEDAVKPNTIIDTLDNNKRKLCKKDAKFYMLTLSPSKKELQHIGETPEEQSKRLKEFVRNELMEEYAQSFNKGLEASDIMYFGKVHYERKTDKGENNLHVHLVVSRKTKDGKRKISPKTNHKNTKKGPVRGGFSRVSFFENAEKRFDNHFLYQRKKEEQFTYKKQYKKAKPKELKKLINQKYEYNERLDREREELLQQLEDKGFSENQISRLFAGETVEREYSGQESYRNDTMDKFYLKREDDGFFELENKTDELYDSENSNIPAGILNAITSGLSDGQQEAIDDYKKKKKKRKKKGKKKNKKESKTRTIRPRRGRGL